MATLQSSFPQQLTVLESRLGSVSQSLEAKFSDALSGVKSEILDRIGKSAAHAERALREAESVRRDGDRVRRGVREDVARMGEGVRVRVYFSLFLSLSMHQTVSPIDLLS